MSLRWREGVVSNTATAHCGPVTIEVGWDESSKSFRYTMSMTPGILNQFYHGHRSMDEVKGETERIIGKIMSQMQDDVY